MLACGGQLASGGSVRAGVGLAAHFGLVGADADSGFCELPKRGGGRVEESWKTTLLVT